METLSEKELATARARMVSLLKSPTATDCGPSPAPKLTAGVTNNVPLPFPKSMETLSETWLATARARMVSLLKSPTATEDGPSPAPKLTAGVTNNVLLPVPKSMETLSETWLATARSRMVSLLKSPTATENGPSPAPKLTAGVTNNVPLPFPKSMETLSETWLATARSRIVSLLKSPTATEIGSSPTPKLTAGVSTNVPLPFPKSMETLSETWLATARSRIVSLLKSPTATEIGSSPTPKLTAGVTNNVLLPFPKSMETLSEFWLATARSRMVSLLKSPTATENGPSPAPKLTAGVTNNVLLPFPKSMETLSEKKLATARSRMVSLLKSPTATENGPSPAPKLTAGVTNVPLPFPKSMETLSEKKLATARSRKLFSRSTFSTVHVCGFPIVISPSHSSEKLVQINKSSSKVEPASKPIVLHIAGVTGSSPCSVTLYGPASNATLVPVPDEPGKLF